MFDDEEQNFLEELIVKKFSNFSLEEPRTPENVKKIRKIPLEQLNANKKNWVNWASFIFKQYC